MTTATAGRAPFRSLEQRYHALERANAVRSYRADLKQEMKLGRRTIRQVLQDSATDEHLATMKVVDLLLATPMVGRVKAKKVLDKARISPSKTLAGMTERQREDLTRWLGEFPAIR